MTSGDDHFTKPDNDECYCDFGSREFFGCSSREHVPPCPQAAYDPTKQPFDDPLRHVATPVKLDWNYSTAAAAEEIRRLMREDFDPHPNYELPAGEWDDNAEDVADAIIATALSASRIHVADAWGVIKKWLADYADEEATFSRYRDDVMLDGIMTAGERRKLSWALGFECCRGAAPAAECGCTTSYEKGDLAAFRRQQIAVRMQFRLDAAKERSLETIGISLGFAREIVRACKAEDTTQPGEEEA